MRLRPPTWTAALAALALALPARAKDRDLNAVLADYGVGFAGLSLPVSESFRRASGSAAYHTVVAGDGSLRVEIEIVSPAAAEMAANYARSKYEILKALYGPQYTPYPGQVTNLTECPPDRKPLSRTVRLLGRDVEVLVANATARHTFGVWEDDLIRERALFCVLYDEPAKTLYQLKLFRPVPEFSEERMLAFLRSFQRNPPEEK